jgi:hypothetical protein
MASLIAANPDVFSTLRTCSKKADCTSKIPGVTRKNEAVPLFDNWRVIENEY